MKKWKILGAGLISLSTLSPHLRAQIPAVPAAPAVAAAPAVPGAPAPSGLMSFLGLTKDQCAAMRAKCCQTPLGQLIGNMLKPVSLATGGVLGNFCPQTPSLADQNKPGAEGEANKVKADEAGAKARRAAIRYLGTVDCHFWPEVQGQLIAGLRADRNECVRWEAAMALGGGCCCTKMTIEALLISATGSDKDGNPSETCPRVKEAALASLQHCLSCYSKEVPAKPEKPEAPSPEKPEKVGKPVSQLNPSLQPIAYYQHLEHKTLNQCVREARISLGMTETAPIAISSTPSKQHGLIDLVADSMNSGASSVTIKAPNTTVEPVQNPNVRLGVDKTNSAPSGHHLFRTNDRSADATTKVTVTPVASNQPEAIPANAVTPYEIKPASMTTSSPMYSVPKSTSNSFTPAMKPVTTSPTQSRGAVGPNAQQLVLVLRNSIYAFQREWAVDNLSNTDWKSNPEVVQALLTAAQKDAAPTVRVMCIRSLTKMKADTLPVVTMVQSLRSDPDPRVVREAEAALAQFGHESPVASPVAAVQPVSYTNSSTGYRDASSQPANVAAPRTTTPNPASSTLMPYTTQAAPNAFSR